MLTTTITIITTITFYMNSKTLPHTLVFKRIFKSGDVHLNPAPLMNFNLISMKKKKTT